LRAVAALESNLLQAWIIGTGLNRISNDNAGYGIDVQPIQVELIDDSTTLALTWSDCGTMRIGAATLRRASRAATEIRRQADGIELTIRSGLYVAAIEPIGNYALRLFFSDGHDRGIYPWSYLRELADQRTT
jgi:DUF971 family protein